MMPDGRQPSTGDEPSHSAPVDAVPIIGSWRDRISRVVPGITVALLGTLAAAYLSERYGAPLTLMALLIGLSLNFLSADERLAAGLNLCSGTLLRVSIVLVGSRVTLAQIADLGPLALVSIAAIVAITILIGVVTARLLKCGTAFGALAGGAVGICGASAAMAIFAALGERRISKTELSIVLIGVSCLSPLAMISYPIIAHELELTAEQAGFFLGASIHDVAQALGAGYSLSEHTGETAAIVKLGRVIFLVPALFVLSICFRGRARAGTGAPVLPWFVVGFFVMAGLHSLNFIPSRIEEAAMALTPLLLACAVSATAIQSKLRTLHKDGAVRLGVMLAATFGAFAAALIAASTLI